MVDHAHWLERIFLLKFSALDHSMILDADVTRELKWLHFFCGGWLKSRRVTVSRCRAWPYVSGFPWFKQHHVTRAIGNLSFWDQVLYVFQASFILPSKLLRMPPAGMAFCALGTAMQSLSESAAPWSSTTRPSPQMFRSPLSSHLTQCEQMLRAYRALVEPT